MALTEAGVAAKAAIEEQLYEPPQELVALDRECLDGLRVALGKVNDRSRATSEEPSERSA